MAYVGPGDLVSGARAWYGLRAYNAAVAATGTQKAINVIRASDSATQDILILTNGNLDVASAAAFGAATTLKVVIWYDQSGNGNDVTQATNAKRPALHFNVLGAGSTLPSVHYDGTDVLQGTIASTSRPVSYSAIAEFDDSGNLRCVISINQSGGNEADLIRTNLAGATISIWEGSELRSGTFAGFATVNAVANDASSSIEINGIRTTGNTGAAGAASTKIGVGAEPDATNTHKHLGDIFEAGMWPVAFTSADQANLNSNQTGYLFPPLPIWRFHPTVDDEFPDWIPPRRTVIAGSVAPTTALSYWRFRPTVDDEFSDWTPRRPRAIVPGETPSSLSARRWRFWIDDDDDASPWYPIRRRRTPIMGRMRSKPPHWFAEDEADPELWSPIRRVAALGQVVHLHGQITAQMALAGTPATSPVGRPLSFPDPLWVAVEFDLWDAVAPENADGTTTIRLSNRGPMTRMVAGTLYQYLPRLQQAPILLGTTLTIFSGGGGSTSATGSNTPIDPANPGARTSSFAPSMFQQPLRGQPNGGTITWAIDPDFANDLNFGRFRWLGRRFRAYEGHTASDIGADVDGSGLTLVYTGDIAGLTYDLAASGGATATVQTTDASSSLDKSLVDDLYPTDFNIVSLQGKTKPELRGRALSIDPVLEDAANLVYRVTRIEPGVIELDDITEVRVGGVPWDRVIAGSTFVSPWLAATLPNLLAQYAALPAPLQADYNAVVNADFIATGGANYNNGPGLQNKVNLVALLTAYNALSPAQQAAFSSTVGSNTGFYDNSPAGVVNKFNLVASYYATAPAQGQWAPDLAGGTFKLGAITGGAEVRCDAQTIGWQTLDTAQLITDICTEKGVAIDPASMAQLRLHWPGLTHYFTAAGAATNALDALDQITLANLCWWTFGADAAVIAGFVDGPDQFVADFVLFGSNPQMPLDVNLLPPAANAIDPVPKELASNQLTQLLPPAWRIRTGYAKRWSPGSQFLGGITAQEQAFWSAPELVEDWSNATGQAGWSLSPTDGAAIRKAEPRAQDLYLSTLAWREQEAFDLRLHMVQRITLDFEREIYDVTAWLPAAQIQLFQTVRILWVDDNDRTQAIYGGTYRITSAIRSIGGGPQQLELWGSSSSGAYPRTSSFLAPPVTPSQVPTAIGFTVFPVTLP
jgi:hypothetical protein